MEVNIRFTCINYLYIPSHFRPRSQQQGSDCPMSIACKTPPCLRFCGQARSPLTNRHNTRILNVSQCQSETQLRQPTDGECDINVLQRSESVRQICSYVLILLEMATLLLNLKDDTSRSSSFASGATAGVLTPTTLRGATAAATAEGGAEGGGVGVNPFIKEALLPLFFVLESKELLLPVL